MFMTDTPLQEPDEPVQEKKMQDVLSIKLSLYALLAIAAQPNHCFENAWRTFLSSPKHFKQGRCVEGWIVFDLEREVVLNEHGWCELQDGTIVDPSILFLVDPDQPVYYFPGVTRDWQEMQTLVQGQCIFPYVRFDGKHGADGLGHPRYKAAHEAALRKVDHLAHAQTPAKTKTLLTAQDGSQGAEGIGLTFHLHIVSLDRREGDPTDA
jgi:hypothetical protein